MLWLVRNQALLRTRLKTPNQTTQHLPPPPVSVSMVTPPETTPGRKSDWKSREGSHLGRKPMRDPQTLRRPSWRWQLRKKTAAKRTIILVRRTMMPAAIRWYPMYQMSPRTMTVGTADEKCHRGRPFRPASSAAAINAANAIIIRKTRMKKFRPDTRKIIVKNQ